MHAQATIGFGFTSDWLVAKTLNQSLSEVMQNQSNSLITRLCSKQNFGEPFRLPSISAGVPSPPSWAPELINYLRSTTQQDLHPSLSQQNIAATALVIVELASARKTRNPSNFSFHTLGLKVKK